MRANRDDHHVDQAEAAPRDFDVGRLGLGTVPLGNYLRTISDADAEAVVHRAYQLGVRYFDTAPLYGSGVAERRLGRALAGLPRDSYVISTKVGRLLKADAPPDPTLLDHGRPIYRDIPALNPVTDFSADAVRRSLDESLTRLGLDRIDIVYLHDPDDHDPAVIAQAYAALDRLRSDGTIRAIGVGASDVPILRRMAAVADFDVFLIAGRATLLDSTALPQLVPECLARGIQIIAGGVFNSGILAAQPGDGTFDYRAAPPDVHERVHTMRELCAEFDVPLMAAAIQYPLQQPGVNTVVVGAGSVAELENDHAALDLMIPPQFWARLARSSLSEG